MAMAMAMMLKPFAIIVRKPTEHPPSRFSHTPPTSSSRLPPSLRLSFKHAAMPITPLLKERKGFGVNKNSSAFWALSVWDNMVQTDKKLLSPRAAKGDTSVAETKDEEGKTKIHDKTKRMRSVGKLNRKVYAVIVGASFIAVVAIFSFVQLPKQQQSQCILVPYSDLVGSIHDGSVTHVQFVENSRKIYYNTKSSSSIETESPGFLKAFLVPKWQYRTLNVEDDALRVIKMLQSKEIPYGAHPDHLFVTINNFMFGRLMRRLFSFMYCNFSTFIGIWHTWYQINGMRGFQKLRKRRRNKKQSTTFDDVEGADAAKAELLEIVSCIKGDGKYMKLGAKLPRGVLLAGPPGTGKTLLARAVAGEADVPFFSISASELVEVFTGTGAARVRDLFGQARRHSPAIIFIDEIDAVGGQRGISLNSERDQALNQLLTEMDGFEKGAKVVVIGATNRPESLDTALMRPGRFSRKVVVGVPDEDGRRKIFGLYLKEVPVAAEEDKQVICDLVASRTPGLVGADLENIAHESLLLAARRDGDFVTKEDVLQAVERATTKPWNDDHSATKAKSFGQMAQDWLLGRLMAQESMHFRSASQSSNYL